MAMVAMPLIASTDTDNDVASGGAFGKTNPTINTKESNENAYAFSSYDPPSASGCDGGGDIGYKPSTMYESLPDN